GPDEPRERVGDLDGLGAGEREHDTVAGCAGEPLDLVERVVPRNLAEAVAARAPERRRHPVRRAQSGEREPALVAEPTLVDLRVVARQDPLDLALACRRRDVAADRAKAADGR